MSYRSFYLNKNLPPNAGLGTQVWLLKIPRTAVSPGGRSLLGSLVEKINDSFLGIFGSDYPAPWPMSDVGLVLNKIQQLSGALGVDPAKVIDSDQLAGISVVLDHNFGLDLSASGTIPGVPVNLSLAVDYSSTSSVTMSFGAGSRIEYIPTDYLSRLCKHFKGDAKKAFSSVAVSIPSNLIVDVVVIGTNYAVEFTQKNALSSSFAAQATAATTNAGGKFAVTQTDDLKFKVTVTDGVDYLVGLQTIAWDQLDSK
jgi:hypothetical protein